jgi:hypothetical protein
MRSTIDRRGVFEEFQGRLFGRHGFLQHEIIRENNFTPHEVLPAVQRSSFGCFKIALRSLK